jgi:hypothetical protein
MISGLRKPESLLAFGGHYHRHELITELVALARVLDVVGGRDYLTARTSNPRTCHGPLTDTLVVFSAGSVVATSLWRVLDYPKGDARFSLCDNHFKMLSTRSFL